MYFKNFNIDILQGIDPHIPYTTETVIDDYKNIIVYYPLVDGDVKEQLRNRFPIPPDQISMCFCHKEMPPHKDHLPHNVCMNYYIDTANCTTQFYEKKTPEEMAALGNLGALAKPFTLQSNHMAQQESENIFWKTTLKRVDSFKAKDNEYWLLNVRSIRLLQQRNAGSEAGVQPHDAFCADDLHAEGAGGLFQTHSTAKGDVHA